jgi:hypothetical protein
MQVCATGFSLERLACSSWTRFSVSKFGVNRMGSKVLGTRTAGKLLMVTLGLLAAIHGTQTFDPNYGDWQRYRLKVLHDFGMLYYRTVKEEDPDHLVWIEINMDLYGYTWQRLCVWWRLTDIFDAFNLGPDAIAEGGTLRTAMNRAIRDNYKKGATRHLSWANSPCVLMKPHHRPSDNTSEEAGLSL